MRTEAPLAKGEMSSGQSRAKGARIDPPARGPGLLACARLFPYQCFVWFILIFGLAAPLRAQQSAYEEGRTRLCAVDIFVDSKSAPLAAWQIEFAATNGVAKIVGIEGGDTGPFHDPPFYDPKAIQNERVIIAAFSTEPSAKLPAGKTRVATIHLQIIGNARPAFELKVRAAAETEGKTIPVEATFEERKKT